MKNEEWVSKSKNSAFLKMVLALGGMTLGLTLMVVGLIISGFSYLDGRNHDGWSLILLVSSFVFLGLGAHGFDLLHQAKREEQKRKLNL